MDEQTVQQLPKMSLQATQFRVSKMDCPSEERMIRMALAGVVGVKRLDFDIANRALTVIHHHDDGVIATVEAKLVGLNLGAVRGDTKTAEALPDGLENTDGLTAGAEAKQCRLLWIVLIINASFFVIEMTTGLVSQSMGLVADSLDMLADSVVYGLSLFAVGGALARKQRVARWAGYLQIVLAVIGFAEVLRRFFGATPLPDVRVMIAVSLLALIGNAVCLYLLGRSEDKQEAHMQASVIFTSNDVIVNMGVIVSAVLVYWLRSGVPDLLVGSLVFALVLSGALRILRLGR